MKKILKGMGSKFIYHTNLFRLSNFNVRILAYHTVNPKYFESQIKHLVENYNVIPLEKVTSNNKNSVVITFDDGYKNNLEFAYPILKKYGAPATIFIVYDFIDKNIFAWWDRMEHSGIHSGMWEIKKLNPNDVEKKVIKFTGIKPNSKKPSKYDFMKWAEVKEIMDVFEIGSHTLTHPILTNIPLKEAKIEIVESKKKIEEKIGKKIRSFAYPNGNYNESLIKLAEEAGYDFSVIYERGNVTKKSNPFKLYRRGINVNDNLEVFAAKVAGFF